MWLNGAPINLTGNVLGRNELVPRVGRRQLHRVPRRDGHSRQRQDRPRLDGRLLRRVRQPADARPRSSVRWAFASRLERRVAAGSTPSTRRTCRRSSRAHVGRRALPARSTAVVSVGATDTAGRRPADVTTRLTRRAHPTTSRHARAVTASPSPAEHGERCDASFTVSVPSTGNDDERVHAATSPPLTRRVGQSVTADCRTRTRLLAASVAFSDRTR